MALSVSAPYFCLQLKALGIDDVLGFDFLDKPPVPAIVRCACVSCLCHCVYCAMCAYCVLSLSLCVLPLSGVLVCIVLAILQSRWLEFPAFCV
jgi:hypothetical protein